MIYHHSGQYRLLYRNLKFWLKSIFWRILGCFTSKNMIWHLAGSGRKYDELPEIISLDLQNTPKELIWYFITIRIDLECTLKIFIFGIFSLYPPCVNLTPPPRFKIPIRVGPNFFWYIFRNIVSHTFLDSTILWCIWMCLVYWCSSPSQALDILIYNTTARRRRRKNSRSNTSSPPQAPKNFKG